LIVIQFNLMSVQQAHISPNDCTVSQYYAAEDAHLNFLTQKEIKENKDKLNKGRYKLLMIVLGLLAVLCIPGHYFFIVRSLAKKVTPFAVYFAVIHTIAIVFMAALGIDGLRKYSIFRTNTAIMFGFLSLVLDLIEIFLYVVNVPLVEWDILDVLRVVEPVIIVAIIVGLSQVKGVLQKVSFLREGNDSYSFACSA